MLNKSVIAICAVLLLSACGGSGTEFQSIGVDPTPTPSPEPTAEPTAEPTPEPTPEPTATPEPTPEPGSNYLANSDFELGSGDDFTSWTKQNGADTMTATTTEACSGRALQVVNAADGDYWSTQLISDEVTTVSGESYTVSMWIKAEATGGVVRFSTTGPGNTNYGPDHTIATTDWHQVSYTFTADATSTGLALDLGLSAATYSVDEVQWVAGNSPITGTCDAAPGGPVNLFSNGELEQGSGDDFTNWSKWNGAGMMTAATDVSCSGRSLRAEPTGGNEYDVQLVSDAVTTEVGTDYTVSMLIKAETTGGQVRFSTANGSSDQYQGLQAINSTDWQQVSWTFAANAASTRVALDLGAEAVNYNVDDIWMLEGTAPAETDCAAAPVNLLTNGGLEAGSGDDFTGWSKWNGAANLVATTTETYSGTRALQATGIDGNYYEVQFVSDAVTTVVGTQYTASMWIKGSVDGGIVRFSTNYPTASAQYGGDETIGTDWELVTWNFTAQETPTRLVLDLGASAATYYIDDISLTE